MIKSVYVHIPFCNNICSYCDFCKIYYNSKIVDNYLVALRKEIDTYYKGEIVDTIYIGGGTPSSLNILQLEKLFSILKKINCNYIEYTIECNIESITEEKLVLFRKYGINRISIGIQTFNNKFIEFLNRNHNKEEVFKKINLVKKYFDNINVDLMYAIPNQTIDDLNKDLDCLLQLDVKHISTYSLIIEKHTKIYNEKIDYIDEDLDFEMYNLIKSRLNGFNHYEISNFAKKGYESKHNLTYWNNLEYYGFGLGASGYIDNVRYNNTKNITKYLEGKYLYDYHKLSFNEIIENEFILGFRKISGISISTFFKKYNFNLLELDIINKLLKTGDLVKNNDHIMINYSKLYIENDILWQFLDNDYENLNTKIVKIDNK